MLYWTKLLQRLNQNVKLATSYQRRYYDVAPTLCQLCEKRTITSLPYSPALEFLSNLKTTTFQKIARKIFNLERLNNKLVQSY